MTANALTRLHRAFNERDEETFRSLIADDVVWDIPGDHPLAGTLRGAEEFWDRFGSECSTAPPAWRITAM